ncbi:ABC transporter substrate-binding protein [Mucilaginibacter auburnensis]|uniref:Branched-chain amino acid transport system substrate-binding protein n=1 Tax=Mucilaginibacter auburnensis TaxID=1457233 RepID=A0A2H9VQS0_9SPHI|nr:ABC transporter substrate-binding protein [Mucilaginibacter auburnensis]PJJ83133.1 branched-chain amino acid transport system substrate-binding protein [Mucilaginibacter auburnensis]
MKKIFTLAFAALLFTAVSSCRKNDQEKTINVVGLFSLTGNWSSLGLASRAALEVASDDINQYLTAKNIKYRLKFIVNDTKLDPELAKTYFTQAKREGAKFIIGPQSSAELTALKPLIDDAELMVVSQSSTAGSLSIPDDAIFRYCPPDKIEGAAMANTIYTKGIKGLVTVARDDAGNKGLQTSTGAAFTAKGGQTTALTPYAATAPNYAAVIASIKAQVTTLSGTYGADKVGVYLASFDEGVELFKLAAADAILSNVKWFGSDGVALSTAFLSDAAAADFAIKTAYFAPAFGLPVATEAQWKPIAARIKAKTNLEPDAFALAAYDAAWSIAHTLEATNGSTIDFKQTKFKFTEQSNAYMGITGSTTLDENGDRAAGSFDYFGIVKEGSNYVWKLVGKSE